MAVAYALVSHKHRHIGGAIYESREAALASLACLSNCSYGDVVELTYTPPWETDTAVRPSEATAFAQANVE